MRLEGGTKYLIFLVGGLLVHCDLAGTPGKLTQDDQATVSGDFQTYRLNPPKASENQSQGSKENQSETKIQTAEEFFNSSGIIDPKIEGKKVKPQKEEPTAPAAEMSKGENKTPQKPKKEYVKRSNDPL